MGNGIGPFTTVDYDSETTTYTSACNGAAGAGCPRSETASLSCSGHTAAPAQCGTEGPDYDSGVKALVAPPANYPESYVFGVASFSFDLNGVNDAQTVSDSAVPQGGNAQRRLRSEKSTTLVEKT